MSQDEGEIRCICGITDDDGFTIQCEKCFVWQHAICVEIDSDNVPDLYFCEKCEPRNLNVQKAIQAQLKRQKEEKKRKPGDKRRDRFDKPSPKKRKESQEQDGRKRKEFQSPPRNEGEERKRGRPRTNTQPQAIVSFSRLPTPEPIITKIEIPEKVLYRHGSEYAEEYDNYTVQFGDIGQNRIQKLAMRELQPLIEDTSLVLYNESKTGTSDFSQKALVMVNEQYPPCFFVAQQKSVKSSEFFKVFGLFATKSILPMRYISEIKGTICSSLELQQVQGHLIPYPVVEMDSMDTDSHPVLAPPFVFPVANNCWLDSRQYGSGSGRFVRSFCGNSSLGKDGCVNATIKTVILIPGSESSKYRKLHEEEIPGLITESSPVPIISSNRFRVCLFSLKEIQPGQEIIVGSNDGYQYPCICDGHEGCKVTQTIDTITTYTKAIVGDPDIPLDSRFSLFEKIDAQRELVLEEFEELPSTRLPAWGYDSDAERLDYTRYYYYDSEDYAEDEGEYVDGIAEVVEIEEDPKEILLRQASETKMVSLFEGKPEMPVNTETKQEDVFKVPVEIKKEEVEVEKPAVEPRRVSLRDFMMQRTAPSAGSDIAESKTNSPQDMESSAQSTNIEESALEISGSIAPSQNIEISSVTTSQVTNPISVVDLATLAKSIAQVNSTVETPKDEPERFEMENPPRIVSPSPLQTPSKLSFSKSEGFSRPLSATGFSRNDTPPADPKLEEEEWKRDRRDSNQFTPREPMEPYRPDPPSGYRPYRESFPPRDARDYPERRDTSMGRPFNDRRDTPMGRPFVDRRDTPMVRDLPERRDTPVDRRMIPPYARDRMDDRSMTPVPDRRDSSLRPYPRDRMDMEPLTPIPRGPPRDMHDRRDLDRPIIRDGRFPEREPLPMDIRGPPGDRRYMRDDRIDTPDGRRPIPPPRNGPPPYGYPPYERRDHRYPPPPRHGYYPPPAPYRGHDERDRFGPPPQDHDGRDVRDDRDRFGPPPVREYPRNFRGRGRGDWRGRGR